MPGPHHARPARTRKTGVWGIWRLRKCGRGSAVRSKILDFQRQWKLNARNGKAEVQRSSIGSPGSTAHCKRASALGSTSANDSKDMGDGHRNPDSPCARLLSDQL